MTKKLGKPTRKINSKGFQKTESSLAIFNFALGKIGFCSIFCMLGRVPDVSFSGFCQCGWRHQDVLNTSLSSVRPQLSGIRSYTKKWVQTGARNLRAVARWVMNEGILAQYRCQKETNRFADLLFFPTKLTSTEPLGY